MKKNGKSLVTVLGYVDPYDWDSAGRMVRVSISSEDGTYVISPAGLGRALLKMVDSEVQVAGTVEEDDDGLFHMTVKSFDHVDECDLGDDEDEDEPGLEPWAEEAWA